jgi:hypothetical protein
VIGVVPVATTVVGVADASPYTVQVYTVAGPPPYVQVQDGCADVEPCAPANENDVIVTAGAASVLAWVSDAEAVPAGFVPETVIL